MQVIESFREITFPPVLWSLKLLEIYFWFLKELRFGQYCSTAQGSLCHDNVEFYCG